MITENLSTLKINKLTQAQYDRELAAGNIDENELYLTPEEDITVADIVDLTVTSTELNYMSGVNSNVQTQLGNKMVDVPVSASDNGKFLRVVNGVWTAATVPKAEEVAF